MVAAAARRAQISSRFFRRRWHLISGIGGLSNIWFGLICRLSGACQAADQQRRGGKTT
jgi:hypothetical protein